MSPVLQSSIVLLARVGSILYFGNLQPIFHLHMFVQMQEIGWQKKSHSKKGYFCQRITSNGKNKTTIECYYVCVAMLLVIKTLHIFLVYFHSIYYTIKFNNQTILNRPAFYKTFKLKRDLIFTPPQLTKVWVLILY